MQQHGKRLTTATASIVGHTGLPAAPAAAAAAARGGTRQGRELLRLSPKIKYKLLPRRCATLCVQNRRKNQEIKNARNNNGQCAAQGENQCNTRQQSRFSDAVLANANVDAIILPAHSPAIVPELQGNTYIGPQAAGSVFPALPSPFSLLACASLPFPCSVVAKCNHCNRFCTISNALGPQDAAPLALCSLLRGCCLLDAAAVATVAGCRLPPGVVFIPLRLQLIVARAKARGVFFKKTSTSSTATSTEL